MQKFTAVIAFLFLAACSPVQQSADGSSSASQQASNSDVEVSPGSDTGTSAPLFCANTDQLSRFNTFSANQLKWYQTRTSYLPIAKLRSIYYQGTNGHAVVVVHGYNSSPHNQRDVILALTARGFTVIAPLLTGFGSEAAVANQATLADWKKTVDDAVALVAPCHSKVSLIGHSFGGSLVTEAVTSGRLTKIAKVVSLAPFYKSSTTYLDTAVNQVAAQYPTISASALTGVTYLDAYEFFPISDIEAGEPEPALPILALKKVFDTQSLFRSLTGAKSAVPVFLAVSKADMVIDNDYAINYVKARFVNTYGLVYPATDEIGHSFQRDDNNPKFVELMTKVTSFLTAN